MQKLIAIIVDYLIDYVYYQFIRDRLNFRFTSLAQLRRRMYHKIKGTKRGK